MVPILIFAYNRKSHLRLTVEALLDNPESKNSELFIYSDGNKSDSDYFSVQETREYIKKIQGFKSITLIFRDRNYGLANNIIEGLNQHFKIYEKAIIMEDDLITSKFFLKFMNEALEHYQFNKNLCQISGYSYFNESGSQNSICIKGGDCLAWGTWRHAWNYFDSNASKLLIKIKKLGLKNEFNYYGHYDFYAALRSCSKGKNNSWAIRWYASTFLADLYTYYPMKSLALHIGNDGSGVNYSKVTLEDDPLSVNLDNKDIILDREIRLCDKYSIESYKEYLKKYNNKPLNIIQKIIRKIL